MSRSPAPTDSGFTLLELMAVVLIMGTALLLVPPNLGTFGARGRLDSTGNSLVAALNGARERAILDGYEVTLEIGTFREDDEWRHGWRFKFTSLPPPEVEGAEGEDTDRVSRSEEREWLFTTWKSTGRGVRIAGVSERKGAWQKLNEGGKPYPVRFFADGNAEKGVAIRLESEDLETDRQNRTVTVLLNPLTSEPYSEEGEHDLPQARPAQDFGN